MSLSRACQLLGISRQAVYQREQRQQERNNSLLPVRQYVMTLRRFMPRLGTRKLYFLLKDKFKENDIKLGRDGLFNYLREEGLLIRPKRSYTKTTNSKHWMKKHPNLLKDYQPTRSEEVFVSDITYVESDEGVHYLSLVTDAFNRKIMGHKLSNDMKAENVVKALSGAIKARKTTAPLIHHSDRGSQYCSELYQQTLQDNNIQPSMTDGYDCYQNAFAERVNGILKQEFLIEKCRTFKELNRVIDESIKIYNRYRPHLSLKMKTPEKMHEKVSMEPILT